MALEQMTRINPLCDKIAAAANVSPLTVHRLAMTLAHEMPKGFWKKSKPEAKA